MERSKELQGAYLPYDNEEKFSSARRKTISNAGRERTGMGVLIARALQQNLLKDREKRRQSLREYHAFYLRELVKMQQQVLFAAVPERTTAISGFTTTHGQ